MMYFIDLCSFDNTCHVLFIKVLEENGLLKQLPDLLLGLRALLNHLWHKTLLLIEFSIYFRTNTLSTDLFAAVLFNSLHFFLKLLFINFIVRRLAGVFFMLFT